MSVNDRELRDRCAPARFGASLHSRPRRLVVRLTGELDLASDLELRALLRSTTEQGAPVTVVDLSEVTFIDAHAIGLIAAAYTSATKSGRVLGVVGLHGVVADVFHLTGLDALVLTTAYYDGGAAGGQE